MINRRDFLKTSTVALSMVALTGVRTSKASEAKALTNIVYTKDNPGKWEAKVGSHAPAVTVNGSTVQVVTNHPMSDVHYIVRHTVVLADGTVVGAQTFTPADKPESTYELPAGYTGTLYVTSFCNLHDFWLTEATV